MLAERDILKLMSRSYDSKVEAWPTACIIRITADYDNCVDIVKLLFHTVNNIKISNLNLDSNLVSHWDSTLSTLPPTNLDQATSQQIELYTNTLIRPTEQGVSVSYVMLTDTDFLIVACVLPRA